MCLPKNPPPLQVVELQEIEDAITIRVLHDVKKELDIESIEGSFVDIIRGTFD